MAQLTPKQLKAVKVGAVAVGGAALGGVGYWYYQQQTYGKTPIPDEVKLLLTKGGAKTVEDIIKIIKAWDLQRVRPEVLEETYTKAIAFAEATNEATREFITSITATPSLLLGFVPYIVTEFAVREHVANLEGSVSFSEMLVSGYKSLQPQLPKFYQLFAIQVLERTQRVFAAVDDFRHSKTAKVIFFSEKIGAALLEVGKAAEAGLDALDKALRATLKLVPALVWISVGAVVLLGGTWVYDKVAGRVEGWQQGRVERRRVARHAGRRGLIAREHKSSRQDYAIDEV